MTTTIYVPTDPKVEMPHVDPDYNDEFIKLSMDATALWDGLWVRTFYDFNMKEWEIHEDWEPEQKEPTYWLKPVPLTPERINQCIHDICVLQERISEWWPSDEIAKIEARQYEAILSLIKGLDIDK